jgi:hypothetical protein
MTAINSEMAAEAVLELVRLFEENHLKVIIDGGWAVDALLGQQTRSHEDLDIAMPHQFVPLARALLHAPIHVIVISCWVMPMVIWLIFTPIPLMSKATLSLDYPIRLIHSPDEE